MGNTAVIIGVDDPFGIALCRSLLERDWTVFGGTTGEQGKSADTDRSGRFYQVPMDPCSITALEAASATVGSEVDQVDLLICNIDTAQNTPSSDGLDFEAMKRVYDAGALGTLRFIEAFLPLTRNGLRRLCFIDDAHGSIEMASGGDDIGNRLSKAALRMACMILSNHLRKEGYTFRIYLPSLEPSHHEMCARFATDYFLADREDEFRMTILDHQGDEWPL